MKRVVENRWFALFELLLVCIVGFAWYFQPSLGGLPLVVVLAPWLLRLLSGRPPFQRTSIDVLLLLFLATAAAGLWTAYDGTEALAKFWVILSAYFFFYAIAGQPTENLWALAHFFSFIGFFLAIYFMLSHDWTAFPAKIAIINRIGVWWMSWRPELSAGSIHPNGAAGMMALMLPLSLAIVIRNLRLRRALHLAWTLPVLGVTLLGLLMTSSRGALLATAAAGVIWITSGIKERIPVPWSRSGKLTLVWALLGIISLIVFASWLVQQSMVLESAFDLSANESLTSRLQIGRRTLHLIADFPFTGGGLGSFPGLYSQYVLIIPFFMQVYSHNLLLNIALEQGVPALLIFVGIILISLLLLLRAGDREENPVHQRHLLRQAVLVIIAIALIHGMVSDVLYGVRATPLLFFWAGLAAAVSRPDKRRESARAGDNAHWRGRLLNRRRLAKSVLIPLGLVLVSIPFLNLLRAGWYANLGAIKMAQIELKEWPTNRWEESTDTTALAPASELFARALSLNPGNATAQYRLGLIAMQRRDYETAVHHLQLAYQDRPTHRGIAKTLGYAYLWTGDLDEGYQFLARYTEILGELDAYIWFWHILGRDDLSHLAIRMKEKFVVQSGA